MPQQTPRTENDESFPDLDALVIAEIDSLNRDRREPPQTRSKPSQAKVHSITKPTRAPEPTGFFGEEADVLQSPPEEPLPEADAEGENDIFSPEEHAFMTRAVGFLRGRSNADAILGRVWEEVTEGDPEAFFSPPTEDAAVQDKAHGDLSAGSE